MTRHDLQNLRDILDCLDDVSRNLRDKPSKEDVAAMAEEVTYQADRLRQIVDALPEPRQTTWDDPLTNEELPE